MDEALREVVVTQLRGEGFTGSHPHLRRLSGDRIDLVSFQHFSSGGSFVLEVACAPPDGLTRPRRVEAGKVRAVDIGRPRPRLGSPGFPHSGDHWFVYGPRSYDDPDPAGYARSAELARDVVDLIHSQAEPWWSTRPFPPTA